MVIPSRVFLSTTLQIPEPHYEKTTPTDPFCINQFF